MTPKKPIKGQIFEKKFISRTKVENFFSGTIFVQNDLTKFRHVNVFPENLFFIFFFEVEKKNFLEKSVFWRFKVLASLARQNECHFRV